MRSPTIAAIVHYVSHGTPTRADGTQAYPSTCRAAIVTAVNDDETTVDLCVLNPEGMFFNRGVKHNDGQGEPGSGECLTPQDHGNPFRYCSCGWTEPVKAGGTWHWPE